MRVDILGCRGSTPAAGPEFIRYGGETSAVALAHNGAEPTLLLDAGTGLKRLGSSAHPFHGTVLLTHLHWDHTHGLPFAPALDNPAATVQLLIPEQAADPLALLSQAIGPPHFPVTPDQLEGNWTFGAIDEGRVEIGGFEIVAREVVHKGGRTFGYRISDGSADIAYIPDHAYVPGRDDAALEALVGGVDLLFHDSQDVGAEWPEAQQYGHSTVEQTVHIGHVFGAKRTVLFHHSPLRTDLALDQLGASTPVSVCAAAAGDEFEI